MEVIESTVPYNFPVAEIVIRNSQQKRSGWGYLAASAEKFVDDVPDLVGKNQEWAYTPGHMTWDREKGEAPHDFWEVMAVVGASKAASNGSTPATAGSSPIGTAIKLLHGRTIQEFNQEALKDATIKSDPGLVQQILGQSFISGLEAAGQVSKGTDNKYQVQEAVLAAV